MKQSITLTPQPTKKIHEFRKYDINGNLFSKIISNHYGKIEKILYTYFINNQLKSSTRYINDVISGKKKTYYDNGVLHTKVTYKNGKEDGLLQSYYKNKQLEYEAYKTKGVLNGFEKIYYSNGLKRSVARYKNGKTFFKRTFTLEGKTIKNIELGSGIVNIYYHSGQLKIQHTYFKNKKISTKEYTRDGHLIKKKLFDHKKS